MFKESVEFNVQKVFSEISVNPVSGSAFTQARYKVKPELFEDLNKIVVKHYRTRDKKRWKGHVLLAGDGSTLNLPVSKDIAQHFGVHSTNDFGVNRHLARVFFFYDVFNDFVVESKISNMKRGEKPLMLECLDSVEDQNHLLILDRGFGHFCTIKELIGRQKKFCMRLPIKASNFAKQAIGAGLDDFIASWSPSPKEKESCNKTGLDHAPVQVRVTKIEHRNGEAELLVTNLFDTNEYTPQEIGQLYHLRWGVEESFKNLKPKMKIEQFGCKKAEGVYQEFYAHIFCINLVALIGSIANERIKHRTGHRKWQYKYNWQNAYRFLREKIIQLLLAKPIITMLEKLITQTANSTIPIKPDRWFYRDMRHRHKKGNITQYHK